MFLDEMNGTQAHNNLKEDLFNTQSKYDKMIEMMGKVAKRKTVK